LTAGGAWPAGGAPGGGGYAGADDGGGAEAAGGVAGPGGAAVCAIAIARWAATVSTIDRDAVIARMRRLNHTHVSQIRSFPCDPCHLQKATLRRNSQ
jgi:hypothetical protein